MEKRFGFNERFMNKLIEDDILAAMEKLDHLMVLANDDMNQLKMARGICENMKYPDEYIGSIKSSQEDLEGLLDDAKILKNALTNLPKLTKMTDDRPFGFNDLNFAIFQERLVIRYKGFDMVVTDRVRDCITLKPLFPFSAPGNFLVNLDSPSVWAIFEFIDDHGKRCDTPNYMDKESFKRQFKREEKNYE